MIEKLFNAVGQHVELRDRHARKAVGVLTQVARDEEWTAEVSCPVEKVDEDFGKRPNRVEPPWITLAHGNLGATALNAELLEQVDEGDYVWMLLQFSAGA